MSTTIGRQMDGGSTLDNCFQLRGDNGGGIMAAALRKPEAQLTFEAFEDFRENNPGALREDEDAYETFTKILPTTPGIEIDVVLMKDGSRVHARLMQVYPYEGGEELAVLVDDHLVDATVLKPPLNSGTFTHLKVGKREIHMDLNAFNHVKLTHLSSTAAYEAGRIVYLENLIKRLSFVEDAITGNSLNIEDQVCAPVLPGFVAQVVPPPLKIISLSPSALAMSPSLCISPSTPARWMRDCQLGRRSKIWTNWLSKW